jgi:hypothetical protein
MNATILDRLESKTTVRCKLAQICRRYNVLASDLNFGPNANSGLRPNLSTRRAGRSLVKRKTALGGDNRAGCGVLFILGPELRSRSSIIRRFTLLKGDL